MATRISGGKLLNLGKHKPALVFTDGASTASKVLAKVRWGESVL
jgi:hypothetical protein